MGIAKPHFKTPLMKKISKYLIPSLALISILHFGCRTLSTTQRIPTTESPINGMLYYLPIGKITIKGEYGNTDSNSAPSSSHRQQITNVAEASPSATATATATATPTPTATPAALTITLIAEAEADEASGGSYVTPQANYLYEDDVHVTVNAKHLLSTGNVTTEDKTAEIVGALASLARAGATLARTEPTEDQRPFNFTFHPCNSGEVQKVVCQLNKRGIGLEVTTSAKPVPQCVDILHDKEVRRVATEFGKNGLLFRSAVPYKIRLIAPVGKNGSPLPGQLTIDNTQQVLLPNPEKLYTIEYQRMAFVKKVKEVGFTDGMLTDYHQHLPSPILGFLGIPKAIVDAIVPSQARRQLEADQLLGRPLRTSVYDFTASILVRISDGRSSNTSEARSADGGGSRREISV